MDRKGLKPKIYSSDVRGICILSRTKNCIRLSVINQGFLYRLVHLNDLVHLAIVRSRNLGLDFCSTHLGYGIIKSV